MRLEGGLKAAAATATANDERRTRTPTRRSSSTTTTITVVRRRRRSSISQSRKVTSTAFEDADRLLRSTEAVVAAEKTMPPRTKKMYAISPAVDNLDLEATLDSDLYNKKKVVERVVRVDYSPIEATAGERVSLAKENACWSPHYPFIASSNRKKRKKKALVRMIRKCDNWLDHMSPPARMHLLMDAGN